MGIVNVTPDSFSGVGHHLDPSLAITHAHQLLKDGADLLDVGAESSRPGAQPVPQDLELQRLLPVIKELVTWGVPISLDSYKPDVMQRMLDLGVDIINDIYALRWTSGPQGLTGTQVVTQHPSCGVCLMHMQGEPQSMQLSPMQGNVVAQVLSFLKTRTEALLALGMDPSRVVWDPGIGFGKTAPQNFELLKSQSELLEGGFPLLVGWSRKSSLAAVMGPVHEIAGEATRGLHPRLAASLAAAVLAAERGAQVVRVHDVRPTVEAFKVWGAIQ
jgi:dihydropteroate synthase